MKCHFVKLLPACADFIQSMTDAERAMMGAHQVFCRAFADKDWAVAQGPVAHPGGCFGAGFWALPDEIDLAVLLDDDSVIKANAGFRYEIAPMPALAIGRPV